MNIVLKTGGGGAVLINNEIIGGVSPSPCPKYPSKWGVNNIQEISEYFTQLGTIYWSISTITPFFSWETTLVIIQELNHHPIKSAYI